ncbi:MAG: hypothetical protein ACI9BD_000836 [Candidatus Marinamargulisbacteria bacterium]|jgi:hypothetical protein
MVKPFPRHLFIGLLLLFFVVGSPLYAHHINREWRRNPFKLILEKKISLKAEELPDSGQKAIASLDDGLTVQGIWEVGNIYKAMVSQKIVVKGHKVNGYNVKDILKNRVILESVEDNKLLVLWLDKE